MAIPTTPAAAATAPIMTPGPAVGAAAKPDEVDMDALVTALPVAVDVALPELVEGTAMSLLTILSMFVVHVASACRSDVS